MYYNNKGSVLVFVLIVFSIVSTVIMMCIGLNYSNSRISNLNYKNIVMKEYLLSSIELVHSNILKEVKISLENSENEEVFKKYFLGNTFVNNIKNISNSQIQNTIITIPGKINCNSEGLVTFQIQAIFKEDNYTKKYVASVEINTDLGISNTSDETEAKDENLNLDNSTNFTEKDNTNTNYKKEDNLEYEDKITQMPDSNNENIKNIQNYKTETINGYNIDPSSIVRVYNYKEI